MNVTLPNGKVIKNVPEGTTKQQIMDKAIASGLATADDFGIAPQQSQPLSPVSASEVPTGFEGATNQQQAAQGNTFANVANEAMSAVNRGGINVVDALGWPIREPINAALRMGDVDYQIPTLRSSLADTRATVEGGQMADGLPKRIVRAAGELALPSGAIGGAVRKTAQALTPQITAANANAVLPNVGRQLAQGTAAGDVGYGAASGAGTEIGREVGGERGAMVGGLVAPLAVAGGAVGAKALVENAQKSSMKKAAVPSIDELKIAAREGYNEIDNLGAVVHSSRVNGLARDLSETIRGEGFNKRIHPKVAAALDEFEKVKGTDQPISNIDTLRKVARGAASSIEPDEARLGSIMVGKVDDFLDNLDQAALVGGNADEVGRKFKDARQLWQRARKGDDIEYVFERAKNQASGFENGLRTQFRSILNNKKKMRGYTAEEKAAMEQVVRGGGMENTAKALGKFGFSEGQATSMLLSSLGATAGYAAGGAAGGVAVPLIGQVSKNLAQKLTRNNAELVSQIVRQGKDADSIAKAYFTKVAPENRSASELAELLISMKARDQLTARTADERAKQVIADANYLIRAYNSTQASDKKAEDNEKTD